VAARACQFLLTHRVNAYLVGGYVRDRLLGRVTHDVDVVVASDGLRWARRLADHLKADFYPLDPAWDTGRVILSLPDKGLCCYLDVAALRGELEADLRRRDFTINALAVPITEAFSPTPTVIDPTGGQADLEARLIRATGPQVFQDDPLRMLRAPRLAAELGFTLDPNTAAAIRRGAFALRLASGERVRDEFYRLLNLPGSATQVRILDQLGLLAVVLPELTATQGVGQSYPHYLDVFEHSLQLLNELEALLSAILTAESEATEKSEALSLAAQELGPFARYLAAHLDVPTAGGRTRRGLLPLLALLHDIGKPNTRTVENDRVRFIGHESAGVQLAENALQRLRFSNIERHLARIVVANHMRPSLLAEEPHLSRRAIYRFFRDTGPAGVETVTLALADHLAAWGPNLQIQRWQRRVAVARLLLEHYFTRRKETISPPRLVDGEDLQKAFGLEPGPVIGQLLEAIREAQAAGEVTSSQEALVLAARLLQENWSALERK